MNVPIPPIYLYETDYNRYEVMDGQQRLNAIIEFFENRFKLSSLSSWPVLTGKMYADLPRSFSGASTGAVFRQPSSSQT